MKSAQAITRILLVTFICAGMGLASQGPSPLLAEIQPRVQSQLTAIQAVSMASGAAESIGLTISPAASTIAQSGRQQFSAVVSGSSNTAVTWKVSGAGCAGATCGTITSGGVYTAPAVLPKPAKVTVTATSAAAPTKSVSAAIVIVPESSVSVSVSPSTAKLSLGQKRQFSAAVAGSTNASVQWTVTGTGCSGSACGSITTAGLYTAPSVTPKPAEVTVKATSVSAPLQSASATVAIESVSVAVTPSTAQVTWAGKQQFSATITGSTNTSVYWTVAGTGCSGSTCGSISTTGLYTAPAATPKPAQVTIKATSAADSTKSATASVTIVSPVSVTVAPATVQVHAGSKQQFAATVTGATNTAVSWTVAGSGCTGAACGTISTGGLYAAPSAVPSPALVTVTATAAADATKSAKASVTVIPAIAVTVAPATAQVHAGNKQQFTATVTGTANTTVSWTVAGSGCSGAACGTISTSGLYTAPAIVPTPALVSVTATSAADSTKSGKASVTIIPPIVVAVAPAAVQVVTGGKQQFVVTVTGTTNTAVSWSVSGSGCAGAACGTISTSGLFTAPSAVPSPALITVTATSAADTTKSAKASVTIVRPVAVTIAPASAQVLTGGSQQFTATVTGTTNTAVSWTVSGAGCSGVACGTISTSGLYTAPIAVPAPPQVTVTATSAADPTKTASATVVVQSGITVTPSLPTVAPGAKIQFAASGPGTGVVIWSVSGSGCSGITCGYINSTGLYTAPATAPSPAVVTVTATSLSNPAQSGSTQVTIVTAGQVAVTVSPATAQVNVGAQQQFSATVTGSSNTAVVWSVSGYTCAGAACGTITASGLYTAPAIPPNPSFVTVTAKSAADPTKSSSAMVTIAQEIAVSISPSSAQVVVGAARQFTATVTGNPNHSVTWSVTGSGCSGPACGTVSSAGLYTAPPVVPSPALVTVTATSEADGQTSASATVTIVSSIGVTISPTSAVVTVNGQQQFADVVTGTTNTAVTWSVSGPGCSGSTCGTISASGLYTAPGAVPSQATVIVTATSTALSTSSASASVTVVRTNNSKFAGQYAFSFTGFDSNGIYEAAGSFTADGNGNLVSGLEDVNSTAGPATSLSISGTYQMGGDSRGVMTIQNSLGTQTFRFALNLMGNKGRLISFDQSGIRGSGVLELQDPTAFSADALAGGYVLNLTGMDFFGMRIGALGLIFTDGSSFISGSSLDVNDGGSISPTFATFSGTYAVDSTGRGTATLDIPGFEGGVFDFAFYVVSANKLLLVSVDPLSFENPVFSGPAELQTGAPFTTASFKGGSVFAFSGTNGIAPDDTVGDFVFSGGSSVAVTFDQNNGGVVTVGGQLTGAYDVELNGRGTLNLDNSDGNSTVWYMYAISPNTAYIMDASTGAVSVGEMKAQVAVSPFSNPDILGTYLFGSGEPILQTTPLYSGDASFDGGSSIQGLGAVTGTEDMSQTSALTTGQALNGTYSVSSVSNNGRGVILLTSPAGNTIAVWVTSDSEFVGLNIDSITPQPTILHFEQ